MKTHLVSKGTVSKHYPTSKVTITKPSKHFMVDNFDGSQLKVATKKGRKKPKVRAYVCGEFYHKRFNA